MSQSAIHSSVSKPADELHMDDTKSDSINNDNHETEKIHPKTAGKRAPSPPNVSADIGAKKTNDKK